MIGHFALRATGLRVFVTSFAYRHGVPREADLVFDVRFLENPYYVDRLRELTGRDPEVAAQIESDADFPLFLERLWRLLEPLLPRYEACGKTYLTIAIGCTGGRHRSVYVAEQLTVKLRDAGLANQGWRIAIFRHASSSARLPGALAPLRSSRRRSSRQRKPMIGMILVTHGRLAAEFVAALEHVVGPQTQIAAVCIGPEDDMEQRRQEILQPHRRGR